MTRIFVTPSQVCALYMILYARQTRKEGDHDILILDSPPKKNFLINAILDTKNVYPWSEIIALGPAVEDDTEMVAGMRKKLTRKLKEKPLFKPVYSFLLKQYTKKRERRESATIAEKLKNSAEVGEINFVTQTLANSTLLNMFPKAKVNYFEHGIGDYVFIQDVPQKDFGFYCLFGSSFKKYLDEKNKRSDYVQPLDYTDFSLFASQILKANPVTEALKQSIKGKKIACVILENMHVFEVPDHYYTDYIDLCVKQIANPKDYLFVLKSHFTQTKKSVEDSVRLLREKYGVEVMVIDNKNLMGYSVEVLFTLWKEQVDYVFATYSSGIFYTSVLYKSNHTKFYYNYDFLKPYLAHAPTQFANTYRSGKELVEKVFSANCIRMQE